MIYFLCFVLGVITGQLSEVIRVLNEFRDGYRRDERPVIIRPRRK